MMRDAIEQFPSQLAWEPKLENEDKLRRSAHVVVVGMGGSHLEADLLQRGSPAFDLTVRSDYGLPRAEDAVLRKSMVVAASYSGNTEETLDGFEEALRRDIPIVVIAKGGALLERARMRNVPFVTLPGGNIQPRMATGFMLKGLMRVVGDEKGLRSVAKVASLDARAFEKEGIELAAKFAGKVPLVYASTDNEAIARIWKIKFNESAKIPAFSNVFPELNHNEMTGFDVIESTRMLSERFHFVFLADDTDHPRIRLRMEVAHELFNKRGLSVEVVPLKGESLWERVFSSLFVADWTALHLAEHYGTEPEQVPMVEEFKRLIRS